jgi:hypothetical protein
VIKEEKNLRKSFNSSNLLPGPALEVQIVGEFPLKSKIWHPKPKYLVRIRRLREFHALYPPSAGPAYCKALGSNGGKNLCSTKNQPKSLMVNPYSTKSFGY